MNVSGTHRYMLVSALVFCMAGLGFFSHAPVGAEETLKVSKLGDLTEYRTIASDVATIIDTGNLIAAKTRIKDLETVWDRNEAIIKPRAASDWHALDKSIDKALRALRSGKPDAAACKQAVADLVASIDRLSGKL